MIAKKGRGEKIGASPLVLTESMERILRAVFFYRYVTALDVTLLLFSKASLPWVRGILSRLAGGEDYKTNQYLYRFRLPSPKPGNREVVYTLGSRGRDYLAREVGMPADWYFRPEKTRHLGYGQLTHSLVLTRFLIAADRWCRTHPELRLVRSRISYELAKDPVSVRVSFPQKPETVAVIPDAWLLFERWRHDKRERSFPVLLEIDRGTAYQQRFKRHVAARLEFVRSGAYAKYFNKQSVTIAYATTGTTDDYTQARLKTMCGWTREVLAHFDMEDWASIFRFNALSLKDIYGSELLEKPVWYRPDSDKPVSLLGL